MAEEGTNAVDMSGILAAYDQTQPTSDSEQNPNADPTSAPTDGTTDQTEQEQPADNSAAQQNNPTQTQPQQNYEDVFGTSKANAAFAKMRTQNKQMQQTLARLGGMLGVESEDPDALINALTGKMQEFEAKQTQIPLALLQRLEAAERYMASQDEQRIGDAARIGFQKVKDTYKLTDAQLNEFAVKLRDAGKNPFTQTMDLMQEYKLMYFDTLMQKARDEAAAAATQRQQKAKEHSTAPSKTQGSVGGGASSVSSVAELSQLLTKNNF